MHLSDKERKNMIRRVADAIGQLEAGEDAICVLSGIYRQNLQDKSPRQGQLMAQVVLRWIDRFQTVFEDALENPEGCFLENMKQMLAEVPVETQCELLMGELGISEKTADLSAEQLRDSLLADLTGRLTEESANAIPGLSLPEGSNQEDQTFRDTAKAVIGEDMLLAVTAMVIYTMAKNGQLENVSDDLTLSQVTVSVCTEDAMAQIRSMAGKTHLQEKAEKKRKALRITCFLVTVAAIGITALGASLAVSSGVCVEGVLALCGYILLWLGVTLTIYYRAMAEMIREEAETVPYIPVHTDPEVKTDKKQESLPKHLPWPEPVKNVEGPQVNTHPQVFTDH